MTRIKLCGLKRTCDVEWANELLPEYIGFVFVRKSKRYVTPKEAVKLKMRLHQSIKAVGVFVDEKPECIARLYRQSVFDMVQLHGNEDEVYIRNLRGLVDCPIIKAFCIMTEQDIQNANESNADLVLLDSGKGSGSTFDWKLLQGMERSYFLAGGLTPENVAGAIRELKPYGVDASSSLEINGCKDKEKMKAFVEAVRKRKKGA